MFYIRFLNQKTNIHVGLQMYCGLHFQFRRHVITREQGDQINLYL
jgi:hypothetical protein